MPGPQDARGPKAVAKFLRPKSVAIIGMSSRPGTVGKIILDGLKANDFEGDIHLVGRSGEPVEGRPMVKTPEELPEGIDLAVFVLPAAGVKEAVASCVKRKVGSAMVFAAGFAESGEGEMQQEVTRMAREGGLALVGPNCLGFTNNVDGLSLHMISARAAAKWKPGDPAGIALVGQSGGMLGHVQRAIDGRKLPLAYVVTTGNEAGLDTIDFMEYWADDPATAVIAVYSEQIKRPEAFIAAVRRARAKGKPVVVLHPGKSAKAKEAAQSHTGSLVGDYWSMRTMVEDAGALVVSTMDEYMDVIELLTRFPTPPTKGPAIITASGAFVGITNDMAEEIGLDFPALQPSTLKLYDEILPPFGNYGNPLDTTAGAGAEAVGKATKALIDDPNVGMLIISYPIATAPVIRNFNENIKHSTKPKVMVALGDTWQLPPDAMQAVAESSAIWWRSSDRALRAAALYTHYGRLLAKKKSDAKPASFAGVPELTKGPQPEWLGKKVLKAAGIRVPEGDLAKTADAAAALAARIGYPVVLKAQAAALSHKTEAGGVALNLGDEKALRAAWDTMMKKVKAAAPDVTLDGALVEKMSPKGLELMVGAKRDPGWGPVLLVGLGGIWVEALGDVKLLPADASEDDVVAALSKLKTAKLLSGFRGAPAVDVDAVAKTATAIGRLMLTRPDIVEVDVNPLMVHEKGKGATALDALIVTQ